MPTCFPGGVAPCGRDQGLLQRERLTKPSPAAFLQKSGCLVIMGGILGGGRPPGTRGSGRLPIIGPTQGPQGLLHPDGQVRLSAPWPSLRLFMTSLVETQAPPR